MTTFSDLSISKDMTLYITTNLMPYKCQYCGEYFSATRSLKLHQKTARYCLNIQESSGIKTECEEYKCHCGEVFTLKGSFTRHRIRCRPELTAEDEKTAKTINSGNLNQGTINNTIINNINNTIILTDTKPFTINKLTEDYIISKLTPVITKEVLKSGINSITELIIELLLINDGKYCYWCTDKSRKQFKMLINSDGEVSVKDDPNAVSLRTIMSIPLKLITLPLASDKNASKSVIATYEEIRKLETEGVGFMTALASVLPKTPDGIDPQIKAIADSNKSPANLKKIEEMEAELKKNQKRRMLIDAGANEEDLLWY